MQSKTSAFLSRFPSTKKSHLKQSHISVNCTWSPWSKWGLCSATCEGGSQIRSRFVKVCARNGGEECTGESAELRACGTNDCPGETEKKVLKARIRIIIFSVDCTWNDWSSWGSCSRTCGGGNKTRSRSKNGPSYGGQECSGSVTSSATCNTDNCPGEEKFNIF